MLVKWVSSWWRGRSRSRRVHKRQRWARLRLEFLEGRYAPATLMVNSLLDNTLSSDSLVTLREAILASTNHTTDDLGQTGTGNDTIVFAPSLTASGLATINLSTVGANLAGFSDFGITSNITIEGPTGSNGITLNNVGTQRLFFVGVHGRPDPRVARL